MRTFKHIQSKSGKTLFSSLELDMEEKYLFKISAFSMDSYDNLKSFCGSERGVSLDEFILLAVKNEIAKPLSLLFNRSIQEMVFQISGKLHMSLLCLNRGIHLYRQIIVQFPYYCIFNNYSLFSS
jgi:hypothetical protein